MTREEYRAWAEQQPVGRFERINGVAVAMARERVVHSQRKMLVWRALAQAAQEAGLRCEVFTSGVMVEVDDSDFEPDAVVHCGARLSDDAIAVPDPLIIVEVLSPSTSAADRAWKLREYFRLRSVRHYLVVWDDPPGDARDQGRTRADAQGGDHRAAGAFRDPARAPDRRSEKPYRDLSVWLESF
jgi:Uma2 family endonuclease